MHHSGDTTEVNASALFRPTLTAERAVPSELVGSLGAAGRDAPCPKVLHGMGGVGTVTSYKKPSSSAPEIHISWFESPREAPRSVEQTP